jgi:hypothetical protein
MAREVYLLGWSGVRGRIGYSMQALKSADPTMADPNRPDDEDDVNEFEEPPRARTGRFHVQHRGGARIEVGEPIKVGGPKPWMCAVKLVGHKRDEATEKEPEPTQTLLVRTGRGATPEEAQREALANLTLVYGSPVGPPPKPTIDVKPSQRPLPSIGGDDDDDEDQPRPSSRPSFIDMLKGVFKKK